MIDVDRQVREMLQRRADEVAPSPDGWDRILDRLQDEPVPVLSVHRARRASRLMLLTTVAAVLLVALGVTAALLSPRDGGQDVRVLPPAGTGDTGDTGEAVPAVGSDKPVWPLSTDGLEGQLAQPRDAAGAYLSERFRNVQDFAVGDFEPSGDGVGVGRVQYTSPPGSGKKGSVYLRKTGETWAVTSSSSEGLSVHMADYTGTSFTAEASPGFNGKVHVAILPVGVDGALWATQAFDLTGRAERPLSVWRDVAGAGSLIVELRLTDSATGTVYLAELRVESPGGAASGPPGGATVGPATPTRGQAVDAVQHWIRFVSQGDMDGAYDLMYDPGSRSGFRAMESELAEGWGAWARAGDVTYTEISVSRDLTVVQIAGTVSQEGQSSRRTVGVRAKVVNGQWRVNPFERLAPVGLTADDPFSTAVPAGSLAWFVVDGQIREAAVSGTTARLAPPPRLGNGTHDILVIVLDSSGRVGTDGVSVRTEA